MSSGILREKSVVAAANGNSGPFLVGDLDNVVITCVGTFGTDSFAVETSADEGQEAAIVNWVAATAGTPITSDTPTRPTGLAKWMRLVKSSHQNSIVVNIYGEVRIR